MRFQATMEANLLNSEPVSQATQAVVAIHSKKGFRGTGFVYQPAKGGKPLIITNAHVVKMLRAPGKISKTLDIHLPGSSKVVPARLLRVAGETSAFSPAMDIAVLEPLKPLPKSVKISKFRNPGRPFKNGSTLYIIGRALGMAENLSMRIGKIVEKHFDLFRGVPFFIFGGDAMMVKTDSITYPGDSGAPAVNRSGEVIGILSKGSSEASYVVTAKDLYETLKGWGIAPKL